MELARERLEEQDENQPPTRPALRVVTDGEAPPAGVGPRRSGRLRVIGRGKELDEQSAEALALVQAEGLELAVARPRTRAECVDGPRPCPWVGCRHHLFLDVHPGSGSIKLNHPFKEVDELNETCSLDVADRGEVSYAEVGRLMHVTLERVRQIEQEAGIRMADGFAGRRRRRRLSKRK